MKRTWRPTAWIYAHLPLALAIVASRIAVEFAVAHPLDTLPVQQRWIMFGGVALALSSMALMHAANMASHDRRVEQTKVTVRLVAAGVLFILAVAGASMTSLVALIVLAAILAAQIITELIWLQQVAATS